MLGGHFGNFGGFWCTLFWKQKIQSVKPTKFKIPNEIAVVSKLGRISLGWDLEVEFAKLPKTGVFFVFLTQAVYIPCKLVGLPGR